VCKPAHNGEAQTSCLCNTKTDRRVMPWEALCRLERYGPVTTDPFGVRLQLLSHRRLTVGGWQIYSWGNTRALCNELM